MRAGIVLSPRELPLCPLTDLDALERVQAPAGMPWEVARAYEHTYTVMLLRDLGQRPSFSLPDGVVEAVGEFLRHRCTDVEQMRECQDKLPVLREIFLLEWLFDSLCSRGDRSRVAGGNLIKARRSLYSKVFANYTIAGLDSLLTDRLDKDLVDGFSYLQAFMLWRHVDRSLVDVLLRGRGDLEKHAARMFEDILSKEAAGDDETALLLRYRLLTATNRKGDPRHKEVLSRLGELLETRLARCVEDMDIARLKTYGALEKNKPRLAEKLTEAMRGKTVPAALALADSFRSALPDMIKKLTALAEEEARVLAAASDTAAAGEPAAGIVALKRFKGKLERRGLLPGEPLLELEKRLQRDVEMQQRSQKLEREFSELLAAKRFMAADRLLALSVASNEEYRDTLLETLHQGLQQARAAFFKDLEGVESETPHRAWILYQGHPEQEFVEQRSEALASRFPQGPLPTLYQSRQALWFPKNILSFGRLKTADVVIRNRAFPRTWFEFSIQGGAPRLKIGVIESKSSFKNPIELCSDGKTTSVQPDIAYVLGNAGTLILAGCFKLEFAQCEERMLALWFRLPDPMDVSRCLGSELQVVWPGAENVAKQVFIFGK